MLTTLEELQDDTSYFVLICSTRRRRAYQEVLDQSSHPIVVVDTPEEALRQVVRRPPIAVIVDMITGMRAGASNTSLLVLYNLELAWPVVRGTTNRTSRSPSSQPLLNGPRHLSRHSTAWSKE